VTETVFFLRGSEAENKFFRLRFFIGRCHGRKCSCSKPMLEIARSV